MFAIALNKSVVLHFVAGLPVIPVAIVVGVQTFDYGVVDEDGNLLL